MPPPSKRWLSAQRLLLLVTSICRVTSGSKPPSHITFHHQNSSGLSQAPLIERVPHKTVFGEHITDPECQASSRVTDLAAFKAEGLLPYSFVGPVWECVGLGCKNEHWKHRCRFTGVVDPACPYEDRQRMVAWLADLAMQGAGWARSILDFKPCDLWPQIRGRTVWLAGDSISQDMAYGLSCFLVEYYVHLGKEISEEAAIMHSMQHTLSGSRLTTWCFNMTQDTRICSLRANKAPRMGNVILRHLPDFADRDKDIVIMNFGAWYNKMHELEEEMLAFEDAVRRHRHTIPKRTFWRETSAQHFDTLSGDFDPDKKVIEQRCVSPGSNLGVRLKMGADGHLRPAADSGQITKPSEFHKMLSGGNRNTRTQPVIDRLGLKTLRMWNISLMVSDVHKHYHRHDSGGECIDIPCDCSHACSPSWQQMLLPSINEALLRFEEEDQNKAGSNSSAYSPTASW